MNIEVQIIQVFILAKNKLIKFYIFYLKLIVVNYVSLITSIIR